MTNETTKITPKVGLCFLCIDNLHPLMTMSFQNKFFQTHFHPILHPKYYEKVNHHLKPFCVPREKIVRTAWGHISLVEASLTMLREGLKVSPPLDYFIFLSESHIPVMPWDELWERIKKEFDENKGRINIHRGSHDRWYGLRKPPYIPLQLFWKHSQWISMTRELAEFFVNHTYTNQYSRFVIPDEHYFGNVLAKENFPIDKHFFNKETCYVKFHRGYNHPITFTSVSPSSIQMIKENNFWFIRKVLPNTHIPQGFIKSIVNSSASYEIPKPIIENSRQVITIIETQKIREEDEFPPFYQDEFYQEPETEMEQEQEPEQEEEPEPEIEPESEPEQEIEQIVEVKQEKALSSTYVRQTEWYFKLRPQISLEIAQRNNLLLTKPMVERSKEEGEPSNKFPQPNLLTSNRNQPKTMRTKKGIY